MFDCSLIADYLSTRKGDSCTLSSSQQARAQVECSNSSRENNYVESFVD